MNFGVEFSRSSILQVPTFVVVRKLPFTAHEPCVVNLICAVELVSTIFDNSIRAESGTELASQLTVGLVG